MRAKESLKQLRCCAYHTACHTRNPPFVVARLLAFVISHRPTVSQEHLASLPPSDGSKTILLSASRSRGGPWSSSVFTRSTLQLDCPENRSKIRHVKRTYGRRLKNNVNIMCFSESRPEQSEPFATYMCSRPARAGYHALNCLKYFILEVVLSRR